MLTKKREFKFQADQFLIKSIINIRYQAAVFYKSVSWWLVVTLSNMEKISDSQGTIWFIEDLKQPIG